MVSQHDDDPTSIAAATAPWIYRRFDWRNPDGTSPWAERCNCDESPWVNPGKCCSECGADGPPRPRLAAFWELALARVAEAHWYAQFTDPDVAEPWRSAIAFVDPDSGKVVPCNEWDRPVRITFWSPRLPGIKVKPGDGAPPEIPPSLYALYEQRHRSDEAESGAGAEVECANPKCRNRFTRRREDQFTCGQSRCRQWLSRQRRAGRIVTVDGRKGPARPRTRSTPVTGQVDLVEPKDSGKLTRSTLGNCDTPSPVTTAGGSREP